MKDKVLALEHGNKMYYSREIIQLQIPKEVTLLSYTVILLVVCVFFLITFCRINDVIKVGGRVRTLENNSTVKNVIAGKIGALYYKAEQFVEEGELLYSLESDRYSTIECELENRLNNCNEQIECLDILLDEIHGGKKSGNFENLLFESQLDEFFKVLAFYEKQIELLEFRLLKEQNQPEMLYNRQNVDEASMNYSLCVAEMERYKAEFVAEVVQKKKAYELEKDSIEQELIRTLEQRRFLDVRAPVSGFVQEVSLLNKGDYVSAEQVVLIIVPDDFRSFRVEMSVPAKDIGGIVPGMTVKYRLSAFPFYEYKGAEGKIVLIDSDVREGSDGKMYYRVYSDINRTEFINKSGNSYSLKAGIEVDARIVKEKISVMHFICRKLDFIQ